MGTAGPELREPDVNGHCPTSTAIARSQWALLDINSEGKMSHRMPDAMSEEVSDRMLVRMSEYICQIECK
jgi:hypothetical protein